MSLIIDFQAMRDALALKAPQLSERDIQSYQQMDRQLNPHNDHYKPHIRSVAEIMSDRAYQFADDWLTRQYRLSYTKWLQKRGYREDAHGRGWNLREGFEQTVVSPHEASVELTRMEHEG